MFKWARVVDETIVNITEQNVSPGDGWEDVTGLVVGPGMRRINGVWQRQPLPRYITQLAFFRRFTIDEETDIELAATDIAGLTENQRRLAAKLRVAIRRLRSAKYVNLDDTELTALMQDLVDLNLITANRKDIILTSPVSEEERI